MMDLFEPILAMVPAGPSRYALVGAILLAACALAFFVAKRVLLRLIEFVVKKSTTRWDDILLERGVFDRVAWLAPSLV